jgi:fatty acid desaturase
MPIPDRLNRVLAFGVSTAAFALLWAGSRVTAWPAVLGLGVVFSYVLLTNYALLHEAAHENLQSSPARNYWLGLLCGLWFPIPFSMIRITHQGHHLHNRTDSEMFDLYYPHDNRLLKYLRWYGILCGFFWPLVPVGAVLFSILPRALRDRVFGQPQSTGYLFGNVRSAEIWKVRGELLLIVALFTGAHWALGLHWVNTLVLYACFSINWSTRQYVGHAFSRRDIIEGAWNLRHNRLMSWVLLHGEYDRNHHRRPDVSWYYLPRLSPPDEPRPSYFKHYWRQWLGPRPNTEPAPDPTPPGATAGR